jgi:hypothetical protein
MFFSVLKKLLFLNNAETVSRRHFFEIQFGQIPVSGRIPVSVIKKKPDDPAGRSPLHPFLK